MFIYIFLLLSITITFTFLWEHKPYQWKVLLFRQALSPRVFNSLNKPILFLCCNKGFHVITYLDDILVLTHSKHVAKRVQTLLVCPGLCINFSKSEQKIFFFGLCWDTVDMSLSTI